MNKKVKLEINYDQSSIQNQILEDDLYKASNWWWLGTPHPDIYWKRKVS